MVAKSEQPAQATTDTSDGRAFTENFTARLALSTRSVNNPNHPHPR